MIQRETNLHLPCGLNRNLKFIITSVENISFDNEIYKKATVEFECMLLDSNWNQIQLTNGRATLLFGTN
jgi:hypothetical protein